MNDEQDIEFPATTVQDDLLYEAWVLLANGAYWDHTDPKNIDGWDAARDRWRDRWHATLPSATNEVNKEVDNARK